MGKVGTNTVGLSYTKEESLGVLPVSPVWKGLEPNAITKFGASTSSVAREPISTNRQNQKGTIVDLDSSVELGGDLTLDHFFDFAEGFAFAIFNGPQYFGPLNIGHEISAVTATGYTVTADGDVPDGTLIHARGFTNSANNGLKVTAGTSTATEIKAAGLVAEASPPANAEVSICGVEGASGDLQIDASGDLISTVLNFTTLDLTVGQVIWIGGVDDTDRFGTAASPSANRGFARVMQIAANKLTLDKKATTFVSDTGTGKTIHLYFGVFLRNVPVDDVDFNEQSFQFEGGYPNLGSGGATMYEYAIGNYCNTMEVDIPLTDKATVSFAFVGTDTEVPTATRKTGAASAISPQQKVAFNTSNDIARLRITEVDETGLTTYFKSLKLTLNNNVSGEKVIGNLGPVFLNIGNLNVNIEAQILFTNADVITAIRNNDTVTMDFSLRNGDGALFFDLPSITLGGGDKEFPKDATVLVNLPSQAFEDNTLGTSLGISHFPYVPTA